MDQIDRVFVIGHQSHALAAARLLLPSRDRGAPTRLKVVAARRVGRGVLRIELREPIADDGGDLRDVVRVELDMRIAAGMNVALGAVEARRNFQAVDVVAAAMYPGVPGCTLRLPAVCISTGSQPVSSSAPVQITRSALRMCATRLGRASMRCGSCSATRRLVHRHVVAAEFLRERCPLRQARKHVQRGVRRRGRERCEQQSRPRKRNRIM